MCGIVAAVATVPFDLTHALERNRARGRDAWGVWAPEVAHREHGAFSRTTAPISLQCKTSMLANLRAEPTTEHVSQMTADDIQPYVVGDWVIVHNGTIANDKEICTEFGFSPPTKIDSWVIAALLNKFSENGADCTYAFVRMLQSIVGSYSIAAVHRSQPERLLYAVNYRPLYLCMLPQGYVLSSEPLSPRDEQIEPYSWGCVDVKFGKRGYALPVKANWLNSLNKRALVVYSGGLDSTVAAAEMVRRGWAVTLLHFAYGARAQGPERQAVEAVAARLNVGLEIVTTPIFTDVIKGSRLTNTKDDTFAEGEKGAEYAHEWVPARNLIMLSIAAGIAESRGFDALVLGANLEEAGAYPDNEPEFLRRFNSILPFALGDGHFLEVHTPVGNMMKHEIVALGLKIGAPMELSWSCYDAIEVQEPEQPPRYRHCGKCGPCFMRKTAFEINGKKDPVF